MKSIPSPPGNSVHPSQGFSTDSGQVLPVKGSMRDLLALEINIMTVKSRIKILPGHLEYMHVFYWRYRTKISLPGIKKRQILVMGSGSTKRAQWSGTPGEEQPGLVDGFLTISIFTTVPAIWEDEDGDPGQKTKERGPAGEWKSSQKWSEQEETPLAPLSGIVVGLLALRGAWKDQSPHLPLPQLSLVQRIYPRNWRHPSYQHHRALVWGPELPWLLGCWGSSTSAVTIRISTDLRLVLQQPPLRTLLLLDT